MNVYIETLGCPKNFNDTEIAKADFIEKGFTLVDSPDEADIIMVNTCGFINDAKKESINTIFEMTEYKKKGAKLVVSGCLAKRYSSELLQEMPEVDLFVGVNEYDRIADLINEKGDFTSDVYKTPLPFLKRALEQNAYSATLRIAEGCDNRCAYCVIPYIRGGFRSKKMEDVVSEAEFLANKGIKEIILIAQDVTNYGFDLYGEYKLAELVKKVCAVDGIKWVRLMYCYEDRITDELIEVMASEAKVCHYIDIPIQHASDSVLKGMFRRSTKESIINTINRLRDAIPDIHIRTTLICGFPGETDEDFDELLDFVENQKFERLGCFAYSQEEGTPAGERCDQIDEEIKQLRLEQIMRTQVEISLDSNQSKIGNIYDVMIEEIDTDGSYIGRTEYDAPEIDNSVIFTSDRIHQPGDFARVQIIDAFDYDLVGKEV